jgi:sporulation protein YlmC with PRC-barrel domain
MISEQNLQSLIGSTVIGSDGEKIGTLGQVYVDPETGRPNWATVKTGFFGMSESFVTLE